MMRWNNVVGLLALAAALAVGSGAHAAEYTLRFNSVVPEGGVHGAAMPVFEKCTEAGTDGRVDVQLFYGSALGNQDDGIEAMMIGTLDMMQIDTPITTIDDLLSILGLPYIFRDRAHVAAVMDGEIGEMIRERLVERGVRPLSYWEGGFRHITNSVRPIVKPEDLKGIKMRTPESEIRIKMFNHYGANASALPYAEVYGALQLGVFDGQENPLEAVAASRFYEVQKYLSLTGHVYSTSYQLISEAIYQKLPEDIQKVLNTCGKEAQQASIDFSIKADTEVIELVRAQGIEVNEADVAAFIESSKPIWDELTAGKPEARELVEKIAATGM